MDTRGKILAVSYEEFASKGYDGASMSAIAKKVGVSKPALYHYFDSKEDLYKETALSIDQYTPEELSSVAEATDVETYKSSLREYGKRVISGLESDLERLMFVSNAQIKSRVFPAISSAIEENDTRWRKTMREILLRGIELGAIPPDSDIEMMALSLETLISGFSEMKLRGVDVDFFPVWSMALDKMIFAQ